MRSQLTQREQAHLLNQVIDHALTQPTASHQQEVLALVTHQDVERLAERIRRRATWLGHHKRQQAQPILATRDELIMALYTRLTPEGWANAWCDGSSRKCNSTCHAGIGIILLDATGKRVTDISRYVGNKSAFDAEVAALVMALETAAGQHIDRLRVHTDSKALAQLWHERREDPRLVPIHQLTSSFKRIQIRAIPRLHNQAADALAKQAATSKNMVT